ncbi:MAG: DUF2202 domain-containing protein [Spirochaetia bacterium]|nr:DUF2202 domain-containing protein [Spirochaetia bacterium]
MRKVMILISVITVLGIRLFAQPIEEQQILQEITIDAQESVDGLSYMREEEKLARDVYLALYEKWQARILLNIAKSEQNHTDAVAALLRKKGIDDPSAESAIGEFKHPELANLYTELVELGSRSIQDAFLVGAIIEDLDIYDLKKFLSETDDADEIRLYSNLLRGSENHMRSFIRQLSRFSIVYEPRYISEAEFSEILGGR